MSEVRKGRKRGFDYYEVTLWAVQEAYRNHGGGAYPIVQKIADTAAERIKELTSEIYTGTQVQSSVSRTLKKLVKDGKVFRVEKKSYVPNCVEYVRSEVAKAIEQEVMFKRQDVFFMGQNTVVVRVDTTKTEIKQAQMLFEKYLGTMAYFGVLSYGEFLVLMLTEGDETIEILSRMVQDLVRNCYEKQNKKPEKGKIKLTKSK